MEGQDFSTEFVVEFLQYDPHVVVKWLDEQQTEIDVKYDMLRTSFVVRLTNFIHEHTKQYLPTAVANPATPLSSVSTPKHAMTVKRIGPCRTGSSRHSGRSYTPQWNHSPTPSSPHSSTTTPSFATPTAAEQSASAATPVSRRHRRRVTGSGGGSRPVAGTPIDLQLHELIEQASSQQWRRRLRRLEGRLAPADSAATTSSCFSSPAKSTTSTCGNENDVAASPARDNATSEKTPLTYRLDPSEVSEPDSALIRRLSDFFSLLIGEQRVADVVGEFRWLLRLLTAAPSHGQTQNHSSIRPFTSLVNAVLFSARCLHSLRSYLLLMFDIRSLRLLADCDRLRDFAPDLSRQLSADISHRVAVSSPVASRLAAGRDLGDSDSAALCVLSGDALSRPNFADDRSFNAFRRQRDTLYQLVSSCVTVAPPSGDLCNCRLMSEAARQLFSFNRSPVNMYHLARLAVSLLLQHALGEPGSKPVLVGFSDGQPVNRGQQHHSDDVCGQCILLGLGRVEHLFACLTVDHACLEFVLAWRDVLSDSLHHLQLADSNQPEEQLQRSQEDQLQEQSDSCPSNNPAGCWRRIHGSCVLARQLALVTSMAARWRSALPETVTTNWLLAKNRLPPVIDLLECIESALNERYSQLTVLLPWLLVYLTSIDSVTLLSNHHQTALRVLTYIRSQLLSLLCCDSVGEQPGSSPLLFLLLLYERLAQVHWRVVSSLPLHRCQNTAALPVVFSQPRVTDQLSSQKLHGQLLALGNPPDQLVISCLPRLLRARVVLEQYCSEALTGAAARGGAGGGVLANSPAVRRVVSVLNSPHVEGSTDSATADTQLLLERAFYHCHNQSLKRIVTFLVERFSSSLVRHSRAKLLPAAVAGHLPVAHGHVSAAAAGSETLTDQQIRELLNQQLEQLSTDKHAVVLAHVSSCCSDRLESLVSTTVNALLHADEWSEAVKRMCCRLVEVAVKQKINNWLYTSITPDFLLRMMWDESRQFLRRFRHGTGADTDPSDTNEIINAKQFHSPSQLLIDLKYMVSVLDMGENTACVHERLDDLLTNVTSVVQQWRTVLPAATACIVDFSVQLATSLVVCCPGSLTSDRCRQLVSFWRSPEVPEGTLDTAARLLLSAPVMQRLGRLKQSGDNWKVLERILRQMSLASPAVSASLAESCVLLIRFEWPQRVLDRLSGCIQAVVESTAARAATSGEARDDSVEENQQWLLALADMMRQSEFTDLPL